MMTKELNKNPKNRTEECGNCENCPNKGKCKKGNADVKTLDGDDISMAVATATANKTTLNERKLK